MTISIPSDYEKFIIQQVQAGRFADAQDAVLKALSLLRGAAEDIFDELEGLEGQFDRERPRKEIAVGTNEANRVLCKPLDLEEIKAEGRRLRTR